MITYIITLDGAFIRTARKPHACNGGHNGTQRTTCDRTITPGTQYVEYTGEPDAYASGKRYHLECAEQQGLVAKMVDAAKGAPDATVRR